MQQTINQSVQNNLNKLERDCKSVDAKISELLGADAIVRARTARQRRTGCSRWHAAVGPLLLVFFVHRAGLLTKSVHLRLDQRRAAARRAPRRHRLARRHLRCPCSA